MEASDGAVGEGLEDFRSHQIICSTLQMKMRTYWIAWLIAVISIGGLMFSQPSFPTLVSELGELIPMHSRLEKLGLKRQDCDLATILIIVSMISAFFIFLVRANITNHVREISSNTSFPMLILIVLFCIAAMAFITSGAFLSLSNKPGRMHSFFLENSDRLASTSLVIFVMLVWFVENALFMMTSFFFKLKQRLFD